MRQIGLIGYGCVGQGFNTILSHKYPDLQVQYIAVKDKSKNRPKNLPITFDVEDIIFNPTINTIVEAIDDSKAALIYALKILEQGKTLVTANKKMVADNVPTLIEYTREFGGRLYYEAAVCGSIPVIQNIRNYYRSEQIISVSGIVNGSTNFILTLMAEDGLSYKEALQQAQEKGFAEADPTLDVEGLDASNKLSILIYEAFGEYIAPENITTQGITGINADDLKEAKSKGEKIKLIAKAERHDGQLIASVKPETIGSDHPLYTIDFEYNSVIIEGQFSGIQQLTGKGAGSLPTGLAVASDVIQEISRRTTISAVPGTVFIS